MLINFLRNEKKYFPKFRHRRERELFRQELEFWEINYDFEKWNREDNEYPVESSNRINELPSLNNSELNSNRSIVKINNMTQEAYGDGRIDIPRVDISTLTTGNINQQRP